MKKDLLEILCCPIHKTELELIDDEGANGSEICDGFLICEYGCKYPVIRGIPRFVSEENYTESFGFQWRKHSQIYMGNEKQRDIWELFKRKTGLDEDQVRGKVFLDVGVGTGGYAKGVIDRGGRVIGIDLSLAVEAAQENIGNNINCNIVQADLFNLPFKREVFDGIYSIGVLHHTPNCKRAFQGLIYFLKKGGVISIWVYSVQRGLKIFLSEELRKITTKIPKKLLYYLCLIAIPYYLVYKIPILGKIIDKIMPPISKEPSWEDRLLDTFDWYSAIYQSKHTYPEVYRWFKEWGLVDMELLDVPVAIKGYKPTHLS